MNEKGFYVFPAKECKITATGLAPVIGYEPWVLRTIESIKQSLVDGNPVLIRLHSGADYPCSSNEQTYELDMESHAVLIIGYDDKEEAFDIVNPWKKEWGGAYCGIEKLPYERMPIVCVNATAEKASRLSLPEHKIIKCIDSNGNISLKLRLGYYVPKGYIIDAKDNAFTSFDISTNLTIDGVSKAYRQHLEGRWPVGEYAETSIPLGKDLSGDLEVVFTISARLEGNRPYSYSDKINFSFTENISLEKKASNAQFESIAQ